MSRKSLRRWAVVAAVATAGGLVVPLINAGAASAAEPTSIFVNNTDQNQFVTVPPSGSVTYNGVLQSGSGTLQHGVYWNVASGPDVNVGLPLAGTPCTVGGGGSTFSCTVNYTAASGVDTIRFFYDNAGTGTYQNGDLTATGTLTKSGAPATYTLTPVTTSHAAQGTEREYTVAVTDSGGHPVPNYPVDVSATQSNTAANSDIYLSTVGANDAFNGLSNGGTHHGRQHLLPVTTDGSGSTVGQASFWVGSNAKGTVDIAITQAIPTATQINDPYSTPTNPNPLPTKLASGTLTVNGGAPDDVKTVTLSPAPNQTAFTNSTVAVIATLTNAQGDPVGGVGASATPGTAPNVGLEAKVTAGEDAGTGNTYLTDISGPTSGLGLAELHFNAGSTQTTDTVTAWVNKDNGATNSAGLDPDEPSATTQVTTQDSTVGAGSLVPLPQPYRDLNVAAGTHTVSTTFQLTTDGVHPGGPGTPPAGQPVAGVLVAFHSTPGGPQYTVSSQYSIQQSFASVAYGVTDANGKITVTVNDANAADGDSTTVTADAFSAGLSATQTINWVNQATPIVTITPDLATSASGGQSATFTAKVTDQAGNVIPNAVIHWQVIGPRNTIVNNPGTTGSGTTFSYTDAGPSTSSGFDFLFASAVSPSCNCSGTSSNAVQTWTPGPLTASQANIDLPPYNGTYVRNPAPNGPYVPQGFTNTYSTSTSPDPTADQTTTNVTMVEVKVISANGSPLFGKTVSLSSSGVGGFTDASGNPIGNTTTTTVDQGFSFPTGTGIAIAYVRSATPGTEVITSKVDGITDTATISYGSEYVGLTPFRVFDTRTGAGSTGTDVVSRLGANTLKYFDYQGTALPDNATAYMFNVTAVHPTHVGNLRLAPQCTGGNRLGTIPSTATINYQVGKDVANSIVMPNDGCGLRVYSDGSPVDVVVDVQGYFTQHAESIDPTRIADTRIPLGTGGATSLAGGQTISVQVGGTAGIPANASAVMLNATAINPSGNGNLRIFPDGASVPNTANLQYIKGVDKGAFVIVKLPADGKVNFYSDTATVGLTVDVFGYLTQDATTVTQAPARVYDSRTTTPLAANTPRTIQVAGLGGVPADAQAVLISVTGIHTAGSTGVGNLRVYPAGSSVPLVANLNYVSKTSDVTNFAIIGLNGGKITLYSDGSPINATVDVMGYTPASG